MLSRSAVAPITQSSELPHFSRHEVMILRKSQRLRLGAVLFVLRLHMQALAEQLFRILRTDLGGAGLRQPARSLRSVYFEQFDPCPSLRSYFLVDNREFPPMVSTLAEQTEGPWHFSV